MPGIVSMVERKATPKELSDEMVRIGRIIFMVLMLIWAGFLVNGQQFVVLWAGAENKDAYLVALILMTAYVLVLTEAIGTQVLWALNEHKEQSFLKMGIVLANILLTVILIKWQPLIGATLGTFISLIVGDIVVMNIIFVKKIGINLFAYYKGIMKGIIPSAAIAVCFGFGFSFFFSGSWLTVIANGIIMVSVYVLCMWLFGLNKYEKTLFGSIIKKVIKKKK